MEIQGINPLESLNPENLTTESPKQSQGFQDMLNQGIHELNHLENKADDLENRLAAGEDVELHDVMIAGQEADIALRMTTQLRNQALEAYREIMRMPI